MPEPTQEWLPIRDYDVVWSREAIYDVADIADYIELRFGREREDRFNDDIDDDGEALGRVTDVHRNRNLYRKKLILKKLVNPSIICSDHALTSCAWTGAVSHHRMHVLRTPMR